MLNIFSSELTVLVAAFSAVLLTFLAMHHLIDDVTRLPFYVSLIFIALAGFNAMVFGRLFNELRKFILNYEEIDSVYSELCQAEDVDSGIDSHIRKAEIFDTRKNELIIVLAHYGRYDKIALLDGKFAHRWLKEED